VARLGVTLTTPSLLLLAEQCVDRSISLACLASEILDEALQERSTPDLRGGSLPSAVKDNGTSSADPNP
jgi:hypothetical protein